MARISIITPYRNARVFLPGLVQIVQRQTFADWECLLVNDGSEDGGCELLEQMCAGDRRFRLLTLPSLTGGKISQRLPARPRNHALAQVRSPLVAFLDCDDLWHPRKLELQLAFHEECRLDISVTAYARFRRLDRPPLAVRCPPARLDSGAMWWGNPIPLLTILIRTELMEPGFPMLPHEDYLLWLNLVRDRPELRYGSVPLLLGFYRLHQDNQSRHLADVIAWTYRVFREYGLGRAASLRQLALWGGSHAWQLLAERTGRSWAAPGFSVLELLGREPLRILPSM